MKLSKLFLIIISLIYLSMTFITSPSSGITSAGNSTSTYTVPGINILKNGINDAVTSIELNNAAEFPVQSGGSIIMIDSEYIIYTGKTDNTLTGCTRGAFNSTATSHLANAAVIGVWIGQAEGNNQPNVIGTGQTNCSGTLYFDFSNNGTLWSSYPVTGFTVTPNINEFHVAVKGPRYFRLRFINTSSDNKASTSFLFYTYFGVFNQGILPLNQSITDDADSTVVRSVGVGKDPLSTYVNTRASGYVWQYSTSLGIGESVSSNNNLPTSTEGYTQIQVELLSDHDGVLTGEWYSDSAGTKVLRTFIRPYFSENGYVYISSPIFGPYWKYTYTNGSVSATNFYIGVKFLIQPLSSQILGLTDFIPNNVQSLLTRSVLVGQDPAQNFKNVPVDTQSRLLTSISGPLSAFGNVKSSQETLQVQMQFIYNINSRIISIFQNMYNFTTPIMSSNGSGLTITTTVTNGVIQTYSLVNGGTGYSVNDPFYIVGGDNNSYGIVATVNSGVVTGVTLRSGGSNYTATTGAATGGGGTGGTGLTLNYSSNGGALTSLLYNTGGTGYTIGRTLRVTGGNNDAIGKVTSINDGGVVTSLEFGYAGTGYTTTAGISPITQENSMVKLTTSVANAKSFLRSNKTLKYQNGSGSIVRFSSIFTCSPSTLGPSPFEGILNSTQLMGIGSPTDGFFVGFMDVDGTENVFGILRRQNGTETFTPQYEFNFDVLDGNGGTTNPSNMLLDPSKGNVFVIQFQWLGFGDISFLIENPVSNSFFPFHIIQYSNENILPSIYNPNLPIRYELSTYTGFSGTLNMYSASASASIEGLRIVTGPTFSASSTTSSTTNPILVIRNKQVFQNKLNRTTVILKTINISNDSTGLVAYKIMYNPTFLTSTWTSVDSNYSVVEYSTNAVYTSTGVPNGTQILAYSLSKDSALAFDLTQQSIELYPGDTLAISTVTSAATQAAVFIWVEDI